MSAQVKLYCAWFCPFAQRAWIALLHKGVKFDYVEQDPYNKSPEWLAINPQGLVPTIVHDDHTVFQSQVCVEYIEDVWHDKCPSLMPRDAYQRAWSRIWCDHIEKKIVPAYYAILLKHSQLERDMCKNDLLKNILKLTAVMDHDGPFFQGQEFGSVDIMLAPFAQRIELVLKHYRGFQLPENGEYSRYHTWWKAVKQVEAMKDTIADADRLIASYKRYSDDTAKTEVADAIRQGKVLP